MYQDTDTRAAAITALIEPSATIPAQLVPYVPPPQPQYIPAGSPAAEGVVVLPDGTSYYGRPPVIFAQPQPYTDPRAVEGIVQAAKLASSGIFAAGAGFGAAEVIGAVAGASIGTLVAAVAVMALAKVKAPKRISVTNNVTENYDQRAFAVATGLFGRATSGISNEKTLNHTSTIN